jgi:hypothetical protein
LACVQCKHGDITAICFFDNLLIGTIPSSIGKMTALTYLNLEKNKLSGTIPPTLANLKHLTRLALVINNLTGVVPPLPFAEYTDGCELNTGGGSNNFTCPLPPNANYCRGGDRGPGVFCQ